MVRGAPRSLLLGLAVGAVSCGGARETGVLLIISFGADTTINQLSVTATEPSQAPLTRIVPEAGGSALSSGVRVLVLLGDSWAEQDVGFAVEGLATGVLQATGQGSVTVKPGAFAELAIRLARTNCGTSCTLGSSRCGGGGVQSCVLFADGCPAWGTTRTCPTEKPFCSQGRCGTCADVGPLTVDSSSGPSNSLALDAAGKVHISSKGGVGMNGNLRYSTNASGAWQTSTVDTPEGGQDLGSGTSLAVDAAGKVHISYIYDSQRLLKYATNASGAWQTSTVGPVGDSNTSIAVDAAGKVHIAYYNGIDGDLEVATGDSGTWQVATVDAAGDVGLAPSLALDTAGHLHLSYNDKTNKSLKVATNASGSWQTSTVATGDVGYDVGYDSSIAVDPAGKLHVSYSGVHPQRHADDSASIMVTTNATGSWHTSLVASTVFVGRGTSLALDAAGKTHISYQAGWTTLMLATDASGSWRTATLDSSNKGQTGGCSSLAIDGTGRIHISYYQDLGDSPTLRYLGLCPQ